MIIIVIIIIIIIIMRLNGIRYAYGYPVCQ
jgi:hypothetical protein